MANVYMSPVSFPGGQYPGTVGKAWEYADELDSAGNGNALILPPNVRNVSVTLEVTGGAGKVQLTTSLIADVIAGTAKWIDWDSGSVAVDTQDDASPCSAIRQVNSSGTTKMTVRAQ